MPIGDRFAVGLSMAAPYDFVSRFFSIDHGIPEDPVCGSAHCLLTPFWAKRLAAVWVVSFCLLYGLWSGFFAAEDWSLSLIATTSLMHFWYDGFIWSVKKQQV